MSALLVGYARCSTDAQDLTAQRDALAGLGVAVERIYVDHGLTGTNRDRPGLREALAACRAGDTLVVTKLDRLARSLPDARATAPSRWPSCSAWPVPPSTEPSSAKETEPWATTARSARPLNYAGRDALGVPQATPLRDAGRTPRTPDPAAPLPFYQRNARRTALEPAPTTNYSPSPWAIGI